MEPNFQTSFIPKKSIIKERAISVRSVSPITIISIFILFAMLVTTGTLYFYKGVLTSSKTQKVKDLDLAKNRFEPEKIAELQALDKRLRASSEILGQHIAVTPIFQVLQKITMKTVRFTSFAYSFQEEPNAKVEVKMSGVAVGYRSIALQADLFTQNKNFIDPVFANLKLDDKGNVLFDLDFLVDPHFVDYKQKLLTERNEEDALMTDTPIPETNTEL